MADKVIAASLQLDSKQAETSVKSFKSQLKDANQELVRSTTLFGDTSKEAAIAAKKVAELKDRMGDAKALADGFNPDRKFQAFGNAVKGVAGGFSALTGTMALFGVEGEEVQKTLLKVQAAMAISDGVNNVLELKDTFKQLGAVIQASTTFQKANNVVTTIAATVTKAFGFSVQSTSIGFKVLKAAIVSTGIGALVVGIGLLVNAITDWIGSTDTAKEAQDKLKKSIEELDKSTKAYQNTISEDTRLNLARAKALGKSEEEIYKIQKEGLTRNKQLLASTLNDKYEYLNKLEKFRDKDGEGEKAYQEAKENYQETYNEFNKLSTDIEILALDKQAKAREKAIEDAKKAADKSKTISEKNKADQKAALEAERSGQDSLSKASQENTLTRIKDDEARAKQQAQFEFNNAKKSIEQLQISEDLKTQLIQAALEKRNLTVDEIQTEYDKKRADDAAEALAKGNELIQSNLQKSLDAFNAQLAIKKQLDDAEKSDYQLKLEELDKNYKDKAAIIGNNEQLQYQLLQNYEKQKTELQREEMRQRLDVAQNLLGQAANLFNKDTAAYKVLAIAQATISTYLSATSAYASMAKIPVVGPAFGIVAAGLAIATGLKNIKEIVKVKVPGASGGGSVPSIPSGATAPLAPQPQVQTTALDQISLNNTGNASVRAFVVESDIQTQGERIRRLSRAARLGG